MKFDIINIEEFSGKKAQIYSIMYEGDDMTLMDHFFEDNEKEHSEDLEDMASKLQVMGNDTGCKAHLFKLNEGAPGDGVVALSYNRMRLYCLRFDNTCIFIGSGGIQTTRYKCLSRRSLFRFKGSRNEKDCSMYK